MKYYEQLKKDREKDGKDVEMDSTTQKQDEEILESDGGKSETDSDER